MTKKKNNPSNNGTEFMKSEKDELFALARIKEKIRIVVGNNIVSDKEFETFEEAENYIASKPYELLINVACLFMVLNQKKNEKETEQTK